MTVPHLNAVRSPTIRSVLLLVWLGTLLPTRAGTDDNQPPTVRDVRTDASFRRVTVQFSEPLANDAANLDHYRIPNLAITSSALSQDATTVTLDTAPQRPGQSYSLTIEGVRDQAPVPNTILPTSIPFSALILHPGLVRVDLFDNIGPGADLARLTNDVRFPLQPSVSYLTNSFATPARRGDHYGARLSGFYSAPGKTGDPSPGPRMFYARGDDRFQVSLSPSFDPQSRQLIIDGQSCCLPFSAHPSSPLDLEPGVFHYIEGLFKEDADNDYFLVAVDDGSGTNPDDLPPVPSSHLIALGDPTHAGTLVVTAHPAPVSVRAGHPATFSAAARHSDDWPVFYQWQRFNGSQFVLIPDAFGPSYTIPSPELSLNGIRVRALVSVPGRSLTTASAPLYVTPDVEPPRLIAAASASLNWIDLCFDETLDPATAQDPTIYQVAGAAVLNALLLPDQRTVRLEIDPPLSSFVVRIHGITDSTGNPSDITTEGARWASSADVGQLLPPGSAISCKPGEVTIQAGGNPAGAPDNALHFAYVMRTNDFDVAVKIDDFQAASPLARAGLFARNALFPDSPAIGIFTYPASPVGPGTLDSLVRPNLGEPAQRWGQTPVAAPPNLWLRLRRLGNEFTGFFSNDGQRWTAFAQGVFPSGPDSGFNPVLLVGVGAVSGHDGQTAQAHFANLTFAGQPVVVRSPRDQTVAPGDDVLLSVDAAGTEPLAYQWRLNGINIPGATDRSFEIKNAQPKDGGRYSVVVIGPAQVAESAPAIVEIATDHLDLSDSFDPRQFRSEPAAQGSANNVNATREPGEPLHAGQIGQRSLWLNWTAPFDGPVRFSTRGSTFDTLLSAYIGDQLENLLPIAYNDDSPNGFGTSEILFFAQAGMSYHIAVDGFANAAGHVVLCWELQPGPPPPGFLQHPSSQLAQVGDNVLFNVAVHDANQIQWFHNNQPIPNANQPQLPLPNVQPANVGSYFAIAQGGNPPSAVRSEIATLELGPPSSTLSQDKYENLLNPPQRIDILPPGGGPGGGGPLGIPVTAGSTASQILGNHNSTTQAGESNHCGRLTGSTRWFGPLYTDAPGLMFEIDTIGSNVDTLLAAYHGEDLLSVTNVACAAGPGSLSTIRFPATTNLLYDIAVDGTNGTNGLIILNWRLGNEPFFTNSPSPILTYAGTNALLSAAATCVPPPSYHWETNGIPIPGANSNTLIITNAQTIHSGVYTLIASNFMGTASLNIELAVADPAPLGFTLIQTNGAPALLINCPTSPPTALFYIIEASQDFDAWQQIWTNGAPVFLTNFLDADRLLYSERFYRAAPWLP